MVSATDINLRQELGMDERRRSEVDLMADADRRARNFITAVGNRRVFPDAEALQGLDAFDETLPRAGRDAAETLALLDDYGSPATVETNGSRYFGFVTGAALPVAAAADRLALAWDNPALARVTSPTADKIEEITGRWLLDILDLPRGSAVGFTTSATAGTVIALAAARRAVYARHGWDVDRQGLIGAPPISVVVSELAHVVVTKALRVLGFGLDNVERVRVDAYGRVEPSAVPDLNERTILVLQAGEVNSGEFDPFAVLIPRARHAGAWVHVDGAFGLWARASVHRQLTDGVELADSWTVDGHKWLNTPYDSAMVIVRNPTLLAEAMNSDAPYAVAAPSAQKNLTLEFSRRPRGIPVWAALRTLGADGVKALVEDTVTLARWTADGLSRAGFTVVNRVLINQLMVQASSGAETLRIAAAAQESGRIWLGTSTWHGEPVMRISVSSWRTTAEDIDDLVGVLTELASVDAR